MKILLVDDDLFLRDMYATKFTDCGHDVVAVENSAGAIKELSNPDNSFDLMLLDMIMPGMSGTELIRTVYGEMPHLKDRTKAIMLSNQGQDEDINEAREAGAIGYIIKAQSVPSEVVERVEHIMKK